MITLLTQPAPTISDQIQHDLDEMWPRVFMVWNSRYGTPHPDVFGSLLYDARWEIWVELTDTSHPGRPLKRNKKDRWNPDANCWMRYLQVYETADGNFAPADRALVIGLQMADTWRDRRFYENYIEDPNDQKIARAQHDRRTLFADGANYYRNHDRLLVGPHANSGWRWRTR